jgi:tetratricopeptide (TPR) repeat protein
MSTTSVGLSQKKRALQIGCLLAALSSFPILVGAQSAEPRSSVSIRELSIPSKALREFDQGVSRLEKQDAAGSLLHFQRAVQEYAGYYEAYDKIGSANLKLWRVTDAEQAFRKSIDVSGAQYAHPLIALGSILDDQEKFAEAESVTRRGLALDSNSWTGQYYRGLALYGLNRLEEAEKNADDAIRLKPDFAEAYLLLAKIHGAEQNYPSLVNDLNRYLSLAPNGPLSEAAKAVRKSALEKIGGQQSASAVVQPQP